MKAPEKIYLQVCGDCTINDKETCEQCYKDNPISSGREVTWCIDQIFNNDVEYTCTDAFIDKAVEYIINNMRCDGYTLQTKAKFIGDFKNYMKGE